MTQCDMQAMMTTELIGSLGAVAGLVVSWVAVTQSRRQPRPVGWFRHDGPLIAAHALGAWIFVPFGVVWALAYVALVLGTSIWFMACVCPHCSAFGNRTGLSAFCYFARHLATKGERQRFADAFRRNATVMMVESMLPTVAGLVLICQNWSNGWRLGYQLFLLASFYAISSYLLPAACRPDCKECDMRSDCPAGSKMMSDGRK